MENSILEANMLFQNGFELLMVENLCCNEEMLCRSSLSLSKYVLHSHANFVCKYNFE